MVYYFRNVLYEKATENVINQFATYSGFNSAFDNQDISVKWGKPVNVDKLGNLHLLVEIVE